MSKQPWYQETCRWAQTNLTEIDARICDMAFWKSYWAKNHIQGIIVNAGGIVAYYPSESPLQYPSRFLGDRNLYLEFSTAAKEMGIAVVARMDINRAAKAFYEACPDWFAQDKSGMPYKSGEHYFSCINSDYYKVYIPGLFKEIIQKYRPSGFADNSWQGASAAQICYCENCRQKFRRAVHLELPAAVDWQDPTYKAWIKWSFSCRLENWDLFNRKTKEYGGEDCLWMGMVNANPMSAHCALYDLKDVGERSLLLMTDHQSRDTMNGLEQNSLNGSLLHGLCGWDCVIPESMANYVRGTYTFRRGSNPPKETRQWMVEGITGGISPWVHYVGGVQEDARQYKNCEPVMQWHKDNQQYLYDRIPVADVGLVWSQLNITFFGQDDSKNRCAYPWRGFTRALTRARIPFLPVHADHIARDMDKFKVLILSDMAVLTDGQLEALERFAKNGGSLVYTGATGMLDEWGNMRTSFPLDRLTGITHTDRELIDLQMTPESWSDTRFHTYLRLPQRRHALLKGFEETDILPFGGQYYPVEIPAALETVATYIPPFPIYPPEFSHMEEALSRTDIPLIAAGETAYGGRIVYFVGDIDRRYGQANLPDHGDLLSNAVRWSLDGVLPFTVKSVGYLDCKMYKQDNRLLLHIVNLTNDNQTPGFVEETCPVHHVEVCIPLGADGADSVASTESVALKVSGRTIPFETDASGLHFTIDAVADHELVVIQGR